MVKGGLLKLSVEVDGERVVETIVVSAAKQSSEPAFGTILLQFSSTNRQSLECSVHLVPGVHASWRRANKFVLSKPVIVKRSGHLDQSAQSSALTARISAQSTRRPF